MNIRHLANQEADRIEADETLTPKEKARYLRELAEQMDEALDEYGYEH